MKTITKSGHDLIAGDVILTTERAARPDWTTYERPLRYTVDHIIEADDLHPFDKSTTHPTLGKVWCIRNSGSRVSDLFFDLDLDYTVEDQR